MLCNGASSMHVFSSSRVLTSLSSPTTSHYWGYITIAISHQLKTFVHSALNRARYTIVSTLNIVLENGIVVLTLSHETLCKKHHFLLQHWLSETTSVRTIYSLHSCHVRKRSIPTHYSLYSNSTTITQIQLSLWTASVVPENSTTHIKFF